jgi:hypothetical protein
MQEKQELKRFISGGQEIDFAKVLSEINKMTSVSARRIGRIVSKSDVDDISSCLFTFLWENKAKFPMTEEEVFAKLKRLVYRDCSLTKEISGFDESFDSVFEKKLSVDINSLENLEKIAESKEAFLKGIDTLLLPEKLVTEYKKIIAETDVADIYEISETDTFLGHIILSFLMRSSAKDVGSFFGLTSKEEETMLMCFSVKLAKTWLIPTYILWGQSVFLAMISFLSLVFVNPFEKYFKNLFLSVRIFCEVDKYLKENTLEESLRILSKKYSIRMRGIQKRYIKVQGMIKKFKEISDLYVDYLREDLISFHQKEKDQLNFSFGENCDESILSR